MLHHIFFVISIVVNDLDMDISLYQLSGKVTIGRAINLAEKLETASSDPPQVNEEFSARDNLLYIFTSGTTGLPKAAILPNSRYV